MSWCASRLLAAAVGCLISTSAFALGVEDSGADKPRPRFSSEMSERVPALAPFAHVVFCRRYASECRPDGFGNSIVELTPAVRKLLYGVNADVNRLIRAQHDTAGPLGDVWTVAPASGDCDDYAVTKRWRLMRLGFPVSALRLAIARTREGEGHAILIVRTDKGELALDNRTGAILDWRRTGLRYLAVQSGIDPKRWFAVEPAEMVNNF